jgi:hypothetical protein
MAAGHYRVRLRTRANRNPFEIEHSLIERDIGCAPAGVLVFCRRNIADRFHNFSARFKLYRTHP